MKSQDEFIKSRKAKRTVMYRNRYKIGKFAGWSYIGDTDAEGVRDTVYSFGPGFNYFHVPHQAHRALYTEVDAVHLIEWLNERNAGYPTGPVTPPQLQR